MVGGDDDAVERLAPIFDSLAPGRRRGAAHAGPHRRRRRRPSRAGCTAARSGAGHFVKMVHNGIEYGLMAAYAEGLNVLRQGRHRRGRRTCHDAETAPLRDPSTTSTTSTSAAVDRAVAAGQRRRQLAARPHRRSAGRGPAARRRSAATSTDCGEGRWTVHAAIDEGVPVPVLSAPRCTQRFSSRGNADFADKVLSAMREPVRRPRRAKVDATTEPAGPTRPMTARVQPIDVRSRRPTRWCCSAPPATSPSASSSRRSTTSSATASSTVPGDRRGPQRLDRRRLPPARPRRRSSPPSRTLDAGRRSTRCAARLDLIARRLQRPSPPSRSWPTRSTGTTRSNAVFYLAIPPSTVPDSWSSRSASVGPQRAGPDRRREAVRPRPGVGPAS